MIKPNSKAQTGTITELANRQQVSLKIIAIYAASAALWILFSDELLSWLIDEPATLTRLGILKGWFFVLVTATLLYWLISRYISALRHKDELVLEMAKGVSTATGEAFFHSLVLCLSRSLDADYAFIGVLEGKERQKVRTIAVSASGEIIDNFSYDLEGTPCANVVSTDFCYYPDSVTSQFPHDHMLEEMEVNSYIGIPLLDAEGQILGLMAVLSRRPLREREIAESMFRIFAVRAAAELERQRTEAALLNQFNQFTMIFDSLNVLVYVADMDDNRILYMNRYGESIFGEDWRDKPCYQVLQLQESPCAFCSNEQLVRDGELLSPYVWENLNPISGRWYQCIDRAIQWTDGRLVRLEIGVDISERKQMEQMKEEMLSAVSHEMRTPLTAMMGFTEFLLENDVERELQKSYLETINKETERLNDLINNFLDLQQLKARRIAYRFTAVSVSLLLQDAVDLFAADPTKHRISIDCPANLPPVRGDESRLHQVLTNILSNAIKYSPAGSPVTVGASSKGDNVLIWVKDEGPGIPTAVQDKIFEKFYRLDNTDTRQAGGTGLGLAVVREVVTAHNGRVWVESSPGKGSVFFVSLPVMGQQAKETVV